MGTETNGLSIGKPTTVSAFAALALSCALAAHEANTQPDWSLVGVYIYWVLRVGMAYLIVIGAYAALGQIMSDRSSPLAHAGLAAALSFPPFVMMLTTMDLILGDPELIRTAPNVLLSRIGLEAAALIDNHLTVSAILLAPYVISAIRNLDGENQSGNTHNMAAQPSSAVRAEMATSAAVAPNVAEMAEEPSAGQDEENDRPGLLLACQPPLHGDLLAAEAQEHYVRLKGTIQGGMALYRFGDAVRDLTRYRGMQVHRSHWVADIAVAAVIGRRGSMKLELIDGEVIPVSRRYELEVEARYGSLERKAG
ncbi:MAG: LytTR family DNA-binding domain-containing protein [Pikeienuella sp.]